MSAALDILPGLLETAVRLQIMALQEMDAKQFRSTWQIWTNDTFIAVSGLYDEDVLITPVPNVTALSFTTLAKAIAALAFVPGGVSAFNQHYEAKRS